VPGVNNDHLALAERRDVDHRRNRQLDGGGRRGPHGGDHRPHGLGRGAGVEVDHIAVDADPVGGRQQEAATHMGGLAERKAQARGAGGAVQAPARHQAQALPLAVALDRQAGQREHHAAPVGAVLDEAPLRRTAKLDNHTGLGTVAAKADIDHPVARGRALGRGRRGQAEKGSDARREADPARAHRAIQPHSHALPF
jgi:hypothetical protein